MARRNRGANSLATRRFNNLSVCIAIFLLKEYLLGRTRIRTAPIHHIAMLPPSRFTAGGHEPTRPASLATLDQF
jgi:hypothetical protein